MTGNRKAIVNFLMTEPDDKLYELTEHKEKRSNNANRYYWELCGKLAQRTGLPAERIYRRHIKDTSNFQCMLMVTKAVDAFKKQWESGHIGRFVDTRESREPGRTIVLAYYGSSDFDTQQMSHLIDSVIEDCKLYDIETLPPDEIERMKAAWGT